MKYSLLSVIVGWMALCTTCADEVLPLETRFQYDAVNRVTNTWNSRGVRQVLAYDAVGNVIQKQVFGPPQIVSLVTNPVAVLKERFSMPFQITCDYGYVTNVVVTVDLQGEAPIFVRDISLEGKGDTRWLHIHPRQVFSDQMATIILTASDGYISNSVPIKVKFKKTL